jgi:hypothetical protein
MVILFAVVTPGKSSASPSRANNFYFVRGHRHSSVIPGANASPARTEGSPPRTPNAQKLDGLKPSSLEIESFCRGLGLGLPPRTCELRPAGMFSFAEFLDHLLVEGRNVIGFATSH